jgi:hypothetical protein
MRTPALRRAYLAAHYQVSGPQGLLRMRIGMASPGLRGLQRRAGVAQSALLTAWNPRSRRRGTHANRLSHRYLAQCLAALGYRSLPACAVDPCAHWPDEHGVLVLGLPAELALEIGQRFGQNAVVHAGRAGVPRLLWTA